MALCVQALIHVVAFRRSERASLEREELTWRRSETAIIAVSTSEESNLAPERESPSEKCEAGIKIINDTPVRRVDDKPHAERRRLNQYSSKK